MNNWKTILAFTYPQDAHMAKGFLESKGLDTILRDEMTAQVNNFYSNAIGGVKLQVKESDYAEGLRLLKQGGYINNSDLKNDAKTEFIVSDKSTNKDLCPFCSSDNIGRKREPNLLTVIVYFILGVIFPIFKKSYKCFDCDKEWKYVKRSLIK